MVAIKLILIVAALLALALVGLAFNILFRKRGKFPDTHVGHNAEMSKRGITCATCDERGSCKSHSHGH